MYTCNIILISLIVKFSFSELKKYISSYIHFAFCYKLQEIRSTNRLRTVKFSLLI